MTLPRPRAGDRVVAAAEELDRDARAVAGAFVRSSTILPLSGQPRLPIPQRL